MLLGEQFTTSLQKFDNMIGSNKSPVGSSEASWKQRKKKKSSGSQKSPIIYNQTTVNAINSNNYIQTFGTTQMAINQTLSNGFIPFSSDNLSKATPTNQIASQEYAGQTFSSKLSTKLKPKNHHISQPPGSIASRLSPSKEFTTENQVITGKKIWNPSCTLRSHLDGVRGLFFTATDPILVTASEDCLLKVWDTRDFKTENESWCLQPFQTARGHACPIFTVTGNQQVSDSPVNYQGYNFVFSAGADGVIKAWNFRIPEEMNGQSPSVGEWQAHHEAIWELSHHPFQPILLSAAADGYLRLWNTFTSVEGTTLVSLKQGELISQLFYKPTQFMDIPTSVAWNLQRESILSGWVHSNNIVSFNMSTQSINAVMKYTPDNTHLSAQVNKVICHEGIQCAISGHEDKQIRFFDLKSNGLIKNLIGHTDAVTSLSVHPNQFYLSSVGHDGSMRTWDIRKYQCIHDIPVHKRKYEESVHAVMCHQQSLLIATGGADGLVKIFHQQDII